MKGWFKSSTLLPEKGLLCFGAVYGTDFINLKDGESMIEAVARNRAEHRRIALCTYHGEKFGWVENGFSMMVTPTYWQYVEFPELPKEEGD